MVRAGPAFLNSPLHCFGEYCQMLFKMDQNAGMLCWPSLAVDRKINYNFDYYVNVIMKS